jgi:hypothetical protein
MIKRVNENLWFQQQQKLLLWVANTKEGRALLCIPEDFPRIVEIRKNAIKGLLGFKGAKKDRRAVLPVFFSDFRPRAKWANIIRYRWRAFQEMAQWYYMNEMAGKVVFAPVAPFKYAYVDSEFFPDPDVETDTVDGRVYDLANDLSWANLRIEPGSGSDDSLTTEDAPRFRTLAASPNWTDLFRFICLFNTGPTIGDDDTIDVADLSLFGVAKDDTSNNTPEMNAYSSAPASNTALVGGDFDSTGTTQFATSITFANFSTTAYNILTFNATGRDNVSKTGVSKFSVVEAKYDAGNTPPTWGSIVSLAFQFRFAETAGTTNDPRLRVSHSAVTAGGDNLLLMTVS